MAQASGAAAGPAAVPSRRGSGDRVGLLELAGLGLLLLLAAVLRFANLPERGPWDADQGHDMLVLRALVLDGVVPLLGPPTSIGAFHHGVLYYGLLAPAAALSGADPLAVVAEIALGGVAAVAVTWWLARSVGGPRNGPLAGLAAAALMAVSASAIEESTFIWNPNLIALSSAAALAAAWRAWTTGRGAWWLVAAAATAVTMHLHVLGAVLLPAIAALLVADLRRRRGPERSARLGILLGAVAIVALTWLPLLVHELGHDFAESRAALGFLASGGDPAAPPLPARLAVVGLRSLAWPLAGLVTAAPLASILAAATVLGLLAWRAMAAGEPERGAVRWLAATLAWSVVALAVVAAGLAVVVPGLPNDHYHAFLDPIVFAVAGLGLAGLWRSGSVPRAAGLIGLAAAIAFNVSIWPPAAAPDGGYPAAERAARRIALAVGGTPYALVGLPAAKSADAYGFPLTRLGRPPAGAREAAGSEPIVVVACDRLLEPMIGAACGGPAEAALAAGLTPALTLVDRFDASPRTAISIYRRGPAEP